MKTLVTTMLAAVATSLVACSAPDTRVDANDEALTQSSATPQILGVPIPRTITMRLGGTDQVLTNVGAGIRSREPALDYLDLNDPLTDVVDGRIPYFVLQLFVPNVDAVVRTPAPHYNSVEAFFHNPFLDSLAAQAPVVMRFSVVRGVESDLFTLMMERRFLGNGLTEQPGQPSVHPEDTQPRADFLRAYRKTGWYKKGEYSDFILERNTDGGFNVTQVLHRFENGVDVPHVLHVGGGPDALPYVKGGPAFGKQILAIMTGFNNDQADPGMAACRQSVLSGYLGN